MKEQIGKTVNNPTYVAFNPNQESIEYIKEFIDNKEHVLVAVRVPHLEFGLLEIYL